MVKNLPANVRDIRDVGSLPGSERSPGEGHGKSLVSYSPWGRTESNATEATWHACRKQPVAALKARNEEAVIPELNWFVQGLELVSSKTGFSPSAPTLFLTYKCIIHHLKLTISVRGFLL